MFHTIVGYWAETQCQLIFVPFDYLVTLALDFFSLFNENVSWVATFHTFFPTPPSSPLFLLAFANLHNFASSFSTLQ
jgi:hypothetical protein